MLGVVAFTFVWSSLSVVLKAVQESARHSKTTMRIIDGDSEGTILSIQFSFFALCLPRCSRRRYSIEPVVKQYITVYNLVNYINVIN